MANFNDDDELDDEFEENGQPLDDEEENGAAQPSGNRNFLLALGVLGGIFLLLVIALVVFALFRPRGAGEGVTDIERTNAVILAANTQTAAAATEIAIALLTPSVTPTSTVTPTATNTQVVALASPTTAEDGEGTPGVDDGTPGVDDGTPGTGEDVGGGPGAGTPGAGTPGAVDARTATVGALLTQRAETAVAQTQAAGGRVTNTPIAGAGQGTRVTGTPTRLPDTGFAEDVGLPGLFGMALGLVLVIVLVRRLRLSTNS